MLISAGVGALSTFKMVADSCWVCSQLISVLLWPSDDIIQGGELDAIWVLELWWHDIQLELTLFSSKSRIVLALRHDLKAADYLKIMMA